LSGTLLGDAELADAAAAAAVDDEADETAAVAIARVYCDR
jgi:hypothetical protein